MGQYRQSTDDSYLAPPFSLPTGSGRRLAEILDYAFYDLDLERHFRMPISRLKAQAITGSSFRKKASRVLGRILQENRDRNLIVALPPSGLRDWYWKVIKTHGAIVIALYDAAENILQRIVFYDDDSNRIEKELDERERALYLREIRKDIAYFRRFHGKANLHVDLSGAGVAESTERVKAALEDYCGQ